MCDIPFLTLLSVPLPRPGSHSGAFPYLLADSFVLLCFARSKLQVRHGTHRKAPIFEESTPLTPENMPKPRVLHSKPTDANE